MYMVCTIFALCLFICSELCCQKKAYFIDKIEFIAARFRLLPCRMLSVYFLSIMLTKQGAFY